MLITTIFFQQLKIDGFAPFNHFISAVAMQMHSYNPFALN